jgi:hypothetical protein
MEVPLGLLELDLGKLRTSKGKPGNKGMTFHNLALNGKPLRFLLLPMGQATKAPWKPSVSRGTGKEQRVNIQFEVTEKQREALEAIEEIVRAEFNFKGSWNSALKQKDGVWLLKAKLNLSGAKQTVVSGAAELPKAWPQMVNACIRIQTIYHQKGAMGLILETEALEIAPPESPFKGV